MNDLAAIRRANLQALCRRRSWGPKELHVAMAHGRYSYWRDLLESPAKSFGEKIARLIEDRLTLGRGYLDEDHTAGLRRYPRAEELLPPPPPPSDFRDRRLPSDSEWQALRDLEVFPEEERRRVMEDLHTRAERWRAIERELTERAKAKAKGSA